ncbi:hypothetical protein [Vibrio mexicanus]|uniref:hypothetical protein n=1 Tax=Vibrio mexicanus TaxID=1004326 RepID=UPI00063C0719|nr:hypothetical protein [Vibrio mexicanus]
MSYSVVNGPAGGMIATGEAMEAIQDDRASMVLAGAAEGEACLDHVYRLEQRLPVAQFLGDKGIIAGEGGFSFAIENAGIALSEGRTVYGIVSSYQNNYLPNLLKDDHKSVTDRVASNMQKAIAKAGLKIDDIDSVHLTLGGIPAIDNIETAAALAVFGNNTPITSSTDYTGFSFGAAGASSLFYACLQLKHDYLAPVLNLSNKPLVDELSYVIQPKLKKPAKHILCHHIDYLGNQVSLVLSKEGTS